MRNVLVTGGYFIGSYICKLFYENGFIPVTFDNLLLGNRWAVKWGPLEIGDLCNKKDLHNLFNKYSFEGVVHLAWSFKCINMLRTHIYITIIMSSVLLIY